MKLNLFLKAKLRKKLQRLSIKNFYLTHSYVAASIDNYRSEKISYLKKINTEILIIEYQDPNISNQQIFGTIEYEDFIESAKISGLKYNKNFEFNFPNKELTTVSINLFYI